MCSFPISCSGQHADLNLIGPAAAFLGKLPAALHVLTSLWLRNRLPDVEIVLTRLVYFVQLVPALLHGLQLLDHGRADLYEVNAKGDSQKTTTDARRVA